MRGTASDVGGIDSATSSRNTVRDNRIVTPSAAAAQNDNMNSIQQCQQLASSILSLFVSWAL